MSLFLETNLVTPAVAVSIVVGKPEIPLSRSFMAFLVSLVAMPRFFMTFGKLFSWSYLSTALPTWDFMVSSAILTPRIPNCKSAPVPIVRLNPPLRESAADAAPFSAADIWSLTDRIACTA